MFFVINKEKIKAYLVSLSTVAILLVLSIVMQGKNINQSIKTSSEISKNPISSVETSEKEIALSINCNKNMDNINNIIDTLSKMNASATFFVTGEIIDKYPEEVKKIINNGNEIGNMAQNYTSLKQKNINDIQKQIKNCNEKITKLTLKEPTLFRAPYGEYDSNVMSATESLNLVAVGWNIDTLDYNKNSKETIIKRINMSLSNGSIILTHNEYISENLEDIINSIQKNGYKVESISNILYKDNYKVDNNRKANKKC